MTEPMYRTPAGTQTETTDDGACDRCGRPRGRFNPKVQGRDPDQPPGNPYSSPPKHCLRCTVAVLSGTDPRSRPADLGLVTGDTQKCRFCGIPIPGAKRQKYCSGAHRVADFRAKLQERLTV